MIEAKSLKECLEEAIECDRLACLARTEASRKILTLSATLWRMRAQETAQRKHSICIRDLVVDCGSKEIAPAQRPGRFGLAGGCLASPPGQLGRDPELFGHALSSS